MKLSEIIEAIKSDSLEIDKNEASNVIVCFLDESIPEERKISGTIQGKCNGIASMLFEMSKKNKYFQDVVLQVADSILNEEEEKMINNIEERIVENRLTIKDE